MPLKTPQFWYEPAGRISNLLYPLSVVYLVLHKIYQFLGHKSKLYQSSIPVICLGNVVMGGSGKTPTALALYDLVIKKKIADKPVFLTRGYGGDCVNGTIVDLQKHTYKDVGDEALLLARKGITIASINRSQGAKVAEQLGADLIIMDDGFQNPSLFKDLKLLVVDATNPFGNSQIFPAGPLREPIGTALKRSDGIISIGGTIKTKLLEYPAFILPKDMAYDKNKKYIAFAGLGRPEKFKRTLERLEYNIVGWYPFADHHPYKNEEIEFVLHEARQKDALLITTEKDFVRIPKQFQNNILTLPIELTFRNEDTIVTFIQKMITMRTNRI